MLRLKNTLEESSINHIYRERNELADMLSKEGLECAINIWILIEQEMEETRNMFIRIKIKQVFLGFKGNWRSTGKLK